MNIMRVTAFLKACLKDNQVPVQDQRKVVENLLGEYMAYRLPIPTTPLKSPATYFNTHHKVTLLQKLGLINESVVFDLDEVARITFTLWELRYKVVYRPDLPSVGRLLDISNYSVLDKEHERVRNTYTAARIPHHLFDGTNVPEETP